MQNKKLNMMVEMALFAGIGVVLNMLSLSFMPQGGGISLAMIPILLISFRWGFSAGFVTGMLIGLIDVASGVTIYHWAQVFLDHCLANAVVGVAGLFRRPIHHAIRNENKRVVMLYTAVAVLICSFLKFAVHVISGVVFFSMYANGQNIWMYSIVYNATPMIPVTAITIICMGLLLTSAPKLVKTKFAF